MLKLLGHVCQLPAQASSPFSRPLPRSAALRQALVAARGAATQAVLPVISDGDLKELAVGPKPVLVHCGADWNKRSREVASALADWDSSQTSGSLVCRSLDVFSSPETVRTRHIKGLPTLLLLARGRTVARADGANVTDLQRILSLAGPLLDSTPEDNLTCEQALEAAEEALARADGIAGLEKAARLFNRALPSSNPEGNFQGVKQRSDHAFRARLGLVQTAVQALEAETPRSAQEPSSEIGQAELAAPPVERVEALASALSDLLAYHEEELPGASELPAPDAPRCAAALAHAELLVDAWAPAPDATDEEVCILRLWACGWRQAAINKALEWYQMEAGSDESGLIASFILPERLIPDRRGSVPRRSLYSRIEGLPRDFEAPGPTAPRALLRRLLTAGIDEEFREGKPSMVTRALGDLTYLLDRKEFVPFFTRTIWRGKGGAPTTGRGTGKRTGFSKRYWIKYKETFYPNTKKMGTPHCDKND
ncbi:unnamed protein product [Symbiodinium natans]|uniref:Thioredoxin domain-containing protein n=1 Tax=Symbiodinium natans TaxID=878477 RepID=A0A812G598_9DINO|nr:unnamed protein product [Symbiodinium natans]